MITIHSISPKRVTSPAYKKIHQFQHPIRKSIAVDDGVIKKSVKSWILICVLVASGLFVVNCEEVRCPGLNTSSESGVKLECILTTKGVQNLNCSKPMPVETVAFYSCSRYFKQTASTSAVKLMRCDESGGWTRMEHFRNLKCEYECGKAQPITKTLIVEGRVTTRQIWPWHALIYYKVHQSELQVLSEETQGPSLNSGLLWDELNHYNSYNNSNRFIRQQGEENQTDFYYYFYICGGTLISPTKILSAAHCLSNRTGLSRDPKEFTVILGGISNSYEINQRDSSSQILSVDKIHIYTSFNYDQFEGDIAIISLSRPAQLSKLVLPVCLPENVDDSHLFISNGKYGEVIGSRPELSRSGIGISLSTQLKSKKLHVLPTIECSKNIDRIPSDKEYCAGMPNEVICGGDSGGGMISSPNFGLRRRYIIQGIVSYARARQLCENYAVFTRVYKFVDWITQILKNGSKTQTRTRSI